MTGHLKTSGGHSACRALSALPTRQARHAKPDKKIACTTVWYHARPRQTWLHQTDLQLRMPCPSEPHSIRKPNFTKGLR